MAATIVGVRYGLIGDKVWDDSERIVYWEYEDVYTVLTESDNDAQNTVYSAPGMPRIGNTWSRGSNSNALARCISLSPREAGPLTWDVAVRWSTRRTPTEQEAEEQEGEDEQPTVHPTDRRPKWRWHGETIDLLQVKDAITGDPIVNKVDEPLLVTRPVSIAVLTITRYQYTFNPDVFKDYRLHTNSTPFWNVDPGIACLWDVEDDPIVIDGEDLREVKYVVKFNFSENDPTSPGSGWKHKLLNHGTKYKVFVSIVGSPLDHYEPFLAMGQPTTGNLDLNGEALPDGDPLEYLDFAQFPEADLNDLKLGPTVWS